MVQAAAVSPKAIPKEPYSAHGMALLGHGHPDPGSLEPRGPRAPQGQRAHFHPAAFPGFCSVLRQLPAPAQGSLCVPWTDLPARGRDAVPGGVTAKPGRVSWQPCSTARKARGKRALLESWVLGWLLLGVPRGSPACCLQVLAEEGQTGSLSFAEHSTRLCLTDPHRVWSRELPPTPSGCAATDGLWAGLSECQARC